MMKCLAEVGFQGKCARDIDHRGDCSIRADDEPWHEPRNHKDHRPSIPCGCANPAMGLKNGAILKCPCGAGYLAAEAQEFTTWRCYDCGRMCNMLASMCA